MILKVFIITLLIIVIILNSKFIIELDSTDPNVYNEIIIENLHLPLFITMSSVIFLYKFIADKYLSYIIQYSTLPLYLISHLAIFVTMFNALFLFIVKSIHVYNFIKDIIKKQVKLKKIKGFYKKSLIWIYKNLDPFYTVDLKSINSIKLIKSLLLISYLIAGIIILVVFNRYIELDIASSAENFIGYFNKEYELYKGIFVVSLIPFTINYLTNKDNKLLKYKNKENKEGGAI